MPMTILAWCLTALLLLCGLAGTLLPLLPGTTLIFAGVVLHRLMLPATISWAMVGWIGSLWILSLLIDLAGVLIGTRLGGGSKWGMAGAGGGAAVGAFVSLPALLLGTVLGAILAEKLIQRRDLRATLLAGLGAGLGFLAGLVGRVACALAMLSLFVTAVLTR
jgi:uncharacterized protein YqgC (DUF456 family)